MYILPVTFNYAFRAKKTPIYAVSSDGTYGKYPSQSDAARELGILKESIYYILKGRYKACGNYTFVSADKAEMTDDKGNVVIDKKLIEDLRQRANESSLYAVDKYGNYKKYLSQKEASDDLGITAGNINRVLHKERDFAKGYSFISANEAEKTDENGKIYVDKDIIEELRQKANKNDFYLINSDGDFSKYNTQTKASSDIGIHSSEIGRVLSKKGRKTAKGYVFIKANSLEEKDKDGSIAIKDVVLNELIERLNKRIIYVVNISNGKYEKFENKSIVAKLFNIPVKDIDLILRRHKKPHNGYVFIRANELEVIDKNGNRIVDKNKIDEIMKRYKKYAI